jgi:hypothetical protein
VAWVKTLKETEGLAFLVQNPAIGAGRAGCDGNSGRPRRDRP